MTIERSRLFASVICLALAAGIADGQLARANAGLPAPLGVVVRHGDALCAYLALPAPKSASRLTIVVPGSPQRVATASLKGSNDPCDDKITPQMQAFRAERISGTIPPLVASIGILGDQNLSQAGQMLKWRSGSAPVTFSSCTSADGVHLGAWQQGHRIWHAYLYVGQDLTPDCTQAQEQP